jgi:aminopeptidase
MGGKEGNTHIALGNSYVSTCTLDISKVSKEEFEKMGYNYSSVHTDMFSTTKRKVVAVMKDGSEVVIYKDGKFTV